MIAGTELVGLGARGIPQRIAGRTEHVLDRTAVVPHRGMEVVGAEPPFCGSLRAASMDGVLMARMPFSTPEARIIVCSDGYFEVFPLPEPKTREKPAYRGVIGELGNTVSSGGLLTVRPDSPRLAAAVVAWSAAHGATAVRGELGRGRG